MRALMTLDLVPVLLLWLSWETNWWIDKFLCNFRTTEHVACYWILNQTVSLAAAIRNVQCTLSPGFTLGVSSYCLSIRWQLTPWGSPSSYIAVSMSDNVETYSFALLGEWRKTCFAHGPWETWLRCWRSARADALEALAAHEIRRKSFLSSVSC